MKQIRWLILCAGMMTAQQLFSVTLHDSSHFQILGKANITNYACMFKQRLTNNRFDVKVNRYHPSKLTVGNAVMRLPINQFDCGHSGINSDFRSALGAHKNPNLTVEVLNIWTKSTSIDQPDSLFADVHITIGGVSNCYEIGFRQTQRMDGFVGVVGEKLMHMRDFQIEPPTALFGLIYTYDEITIRFDLIVRVEKKT